MESWVLFFILVGATLRCSETALLPGKLYSKTACYGSVGDILLQPKCGSEERMVIDTEYALTKPSSTGCPDVMTAETRNLTYCCQFNESDCKDIYTGASMMNYYKNFTGNQNNDVRAARQEISSSCPREVYGRNFTTYMMLEYFCISEIVTASFSDNSTSLTGTEVYLLNTEYPGLINVNNSLQECTVSTSCGNNIVITAIDMSLHNSTECLQRLEIEEGNDVTNIACSNNTGYNITQIYQSSTNFIKLRLNNGQINGGKIWIQINATTPGVVLTLTCGVTNQTTPAPCTTAEPPPKNTAVTAGIIAGLIILIVVILVTVFCRRYKNRKQNRVGVDDNNKNTRSGLPTPSPSSSRLPSPTGPGNRLPPLPPTGPGNRLPPLPPTGTGNRLPTLPPAGTGTGLPILLSSGAGAGLPSILTSQAQNGLPPVQTV